MEILFGAVILFLVLVTFHEYGHYSVARFFKIKILKFSIGFGPDIFSWKNKEGINFSLSAVPIGGYVAFHDPADKHNYKNLSEEDKSLVLANRPAYERALVTLAGPIFNFFLAFFLFTVVAFFLPKPSDIVSSSISTLDQEKIYRIISVNDKTITSAQDFEITLLNYSGFSGDISIDVYDYESEEIQTILKKVEQLSFPTDVSPSSYFSIIPFPDFEPIISEIKDGSLADINGLKNGDKIISINGKPVPSRAYAMEKLQSKEASFEFTILRDGEEFTIFFREKIKDQSFGFSLKPEGNDINKAIEFGYNQTVFWIKNTFNFLFKIFTGGMGLDNLSGPVGIAKVAGDSFSSGFIPFMLLLAILSISLGAFNLLPLPMLDGGQFLFIVIEELKGSPIDMKLKYALFNLSYLMIIALFIFVVINDILRLL